LSLWQWQKAQEMLRTVRSPLPLEPDMSTTPEKPFQYINRKGVAYFLRLKRTQPVRYAMTARSAKGALAELPAGYEIVETPNGVVSIHGIKPRLITEEEEETVKKQLLARKLERYRVEVKGLNIFIHEPHGPDDVSLEVFRPFSDELSKLAIARIRREDGDQVADAVIESIQLKWEDDDKKRLCEQMTNYSPVLRFHLSNRIARLFVVARIDYDHGAQDWLELDELPLQKALPRYLRHLGKDRFYELI